MITTDRQLKPSFVEFVIIVSMMISLLALSIDAILPALPDIGRDLDVQQANHRQLVVSVIFFGLALGQLFFGPLSDKTGRKPAIYAGYSVYIIGSLLSLFAFSFPMMLMGRFLQGAGISAPRSVSLALVRDRYEGRAMARVMSFVMTVFILVPMIAPLLGQTVLLFSGWRTIYGIYILLALITITWFAQRMPETLDPDNRAPFSFKRIVRTVVEVLKIRPSLAYMVTAGLISGAHLGYLNSAQQIYQEQYDLGNLFPLFFALVALSIGLASFLNARLVMRYGMRLLVRWALLTIVGLSAIAIVAAVMTAGHPPLSLLIAYLMPVFFCVGILFGNLNALAMEPLGHIAGIGAAVVGSLSTLISVSLGMIIGQSYNGTIGPLLAGLAILAALSLIVTRWADRESAQGMAEQLEST